MRRPTLPTEETKALIPNGFRMNRDMLLIFGTAAVIFSFLPMPEFSGLQARLAVFAQEMFRDGPHWFPTTYHKPYPDYPATSTFLIYLVAKLFGKGTPLAAVLPTAFASGLTLALTYRIGTLRSRLWRGAAVLLSVLTVEFFTASHSISLDQYTSLVTVLSFYLAHSADYYGRRWRLGWLPLVWRLGFAFRGPVGLILPAAVTCTYYFWHRRFRVLMVVMAVASIALVSCWNGLLLAAKAQGGAPLVQMVRDMQATGRLLAGRHGPTYYWLRCFGSYAVSYPLALLVVVRRSREIWRRSTEDDKLLGSLAAWVLVILVGMSIPSAKKMRYLLPLVPALSLIGAYVLVDVSPCSTLREAKKKCLELCASCPGFAALGVLTLLVYTWRFGPLWHAHYFGAICLFAILGLLARKTTAKREDRAARGVMLLGIAAAVFVLVDIGVAQPLSCSLEKSAPFVRKVEALYEKRPGPIIFYRIGPDAEDIKFTVNLSRPLETKFARSLDSLWNEPDTLCVIAREEVFRSLSIEERQRVRRLDCGKLGHRSFVVLTPVKPRQGAPDAPRREGSDETMSLKESAEVRASGLWGGVRRCAVRTDEDPGSLHRQESPERLHRCIL